MPVPGIIFAGPFLLYELANCVLMLAAKDSVFIIFFISGLFSNYNFVKVSFFC